MRVSCFRTVILLLLALLSCYSFTETIFAHEPRDYKDIKAKYILAQCPEGWANRLRALYFFLFLGKLMQAKLLFVWTVNSACPGHILDIYHPIPNTTFITLDEAKKWAKNPDVHVADITCTHPDVLAFQYKTILTGKAIKRRVWDRFVLKDHLNHSITNFVSTHNVTNACGIHARGTDLNATLSHRRKMRLPIRAKFVSKNCGAREGSGGAPLKIFLSADSRSLQDEFIDYYGLWKAGNTSAENMGNYTPSPDGRMFVTSLIPYPPDNTTTATTPVDKRHTSLEAAVIDGYVASYVNSSLFHRSTFSSFSEWIVDLDFFRTKRKPMPLWG